MEDINEGGSEEAMEVIAQGESATLQTSRHEGEIPTSSADKSSKMGSQESYRWSGRAIKTSYAAVENQESNESFTVGDYVSVRISGKNISHIGKISELYEGENKKKMISITRMYKIEDLTENKWKSASFYKNELFPSEEKVTSEIQMLMGKVNVKQVDKNEKEVEDFLDEGENNFVFRWWYDPKVEQLLNKAPSEVDSVFVTPKRRYRKREKAADEGSVTDKKAPETANNEVTPPRKRGRPRKTPLPTSPPESPSSSPTSKKRKSNKGNESRSPKKRKKPVSFEWIGKPYKEEDGDAFYKSMKVDNVEYHEGDFAYLLPSSSAELPYIGKLTQLIHTADGTEQIGVQWVFRPKETIVFKHIQSDYLPHPSEVFMSQDSDYNPATAVEGKCEVVHYTDLPDLPEDFLQQPNHFFYKKWYDSTTREFTDTPGKVHAKMLKRTPAKRQSMEGTNGTGEVDNSKEEGNDGKESKDTPPKKKRGRPPKNPAETTPKQANQPQKQKTDSSTKPKKPKEDAPKESQKTPKVKKPKEVAKETGVNVEKPYVLQVDAMIGDTPESLEEVTNSTLDTLQQLDELYQQQHSALEYVDPSEFESSATTTNQEPVTYTLGAKEKETAEQQKELEIFQKQQLSRQHNGN